MIGNGSPIWKVQIGKLAMKLAGGGVVRFGRLNFAGEISKMKLFAIAFQICTPPFVMGMPIYAKKFGCFINRGFSIARVLARSCFAKVFNFVVCFVSIGMINQSIWPKTIINCKCNSMKSVRFIKDCAHTISICIKLNKRFFARKSGVPRIASPMAAEHFRWPFKPEKPSSVGFVSQQLAQKFGTWYRGVSHWRLLSASAGRLSAETLPAYLLSDGVAGMSISDRMAS